MQPQTGPQARKAIVYRTDRPGKCWMAKYATDETGAPVPWESSRSVILPKSITDPRIFKNSTVLVDAWHPIGSVDIADSWKPEPKRAREPAGTVSREQIENALCGKELRGAKGVLFFDSSFNFVATARSKPLLKEMLGVLNGAVAYPALAVSPGYDDALLAAGTLDTKRHLLFMTRATDIGGFGGVVLINIENLAPPSGRITPALAKLCADVALVHMPEAIEDPTPVVRTEPFKCGNILDKRLGHALANHAPRGISRIVLYDPSPGGYLEEKHRYHVVLLANSEPLLHEETRLSGFPLRAGFPEDKTSWPAAHGITMHVDYDFRSLARETPRQGDLLLIPVPGLVFKQQWGPDSSRIEHDVLCRCVELAKFERIVRKRVVRFTEDED